MKRALLWLNRLLTVMLVLISLQLFWHGCLEISATTGIVQGSEFGMLISLVNQMGGVRVWLGTFALWFLTQHRLDRES